MPLPRTRLRYADVAATLALILASGGTAYAATKLPAHSVGTAQLKHVAVTGAKLHGAAVTRGKLAKNAVHGTAVVPDSLSLADLVGTDVTGSITFTIPAGGCTDLGLSISGAKTGQAVLVSFTGATSPAGLMTGEARVEVKGSVRVPMCNVTASTIAVSGARMRIVTFG
jgi:hypothetical protein